MERRKRDWSGGGAGRGIRNGHSKSKEGGLSVVGGFGRGNGIGKGGGFREDGVSRGNSVAVGGVGAKRRRKNEDRHAKRSKGARQNVRSTLSSPPKRAKTINDEEISSESEDEGRDNHGAGDRGSDDDGHQETYLKELNELQNSFPAESLENDDFFVNRNSHIDRSTGANKRKKFEELAPSKKSRTSSSSSPLFSTLDTPDQRRVKLASRYLEALGVSKKANATIHNNYANRYDHDLDIDVDSEREHDEEVNGEGSDDDEALIMKRERTTQSAQKLKKERVAEILLSASQRQRIEQNVEFGAAAACSWSSPSSPASLASKATFSKGHKLPITSSSASHFDENIVVTGGKDCAVLRWDVIALKKSVFAGGRKQFNCGGHFEEVSDVCCSPQSADVFFSVGHDSLVRVWDVREGQRCVAALRGHKGTITAVKAEPKGSGIDGGDGFGGGKEWYLGSSKNDWDDCGSEQNDLSDEDGGGKEAATKVNCRRKKSENDLFLGIPGYTGTGCIYTAGKDRTVKIWDLRMMGCLDTHFGHVNGVTCLDVLQPGRPLTGGEDGTLRLWKLQFETHLAFAANSPFVDCCAFLSPKLFLSGSEDGKVSLWATNHKKPLSVRTHTNSNEGAAMSKNKLSSVTALVTVPASDFFFSGGDDGGIVAWRVARTVDGTTDLKRVGSLAAGEIATSLASLKRENHEIQNKRKRNTSESNFNVHVDGKSQNDDKKSENGDASGGVVTSLCLTSSRRFLLATISKESKSGSQKVVKKSPNGLLVIPLGGASQ